MRWLGHIDGNTGWIVQTYKLEVVRQKRHNRPKKTWEEVVRYDRVKLGMDSTDPQTTLGGGGICEEDRSDRP